MTLKELVKSRIWPSGRKQRRILGGIAAGVVMELDPQSDRNATGGAALANRDALRMVGKFLCPVVSATPLSNESYPERVVAIIPSRTPSDCT